MQNGMFAVAATLTFAFIMPEVSFSRDAYSELAAQLFLFTALWLLASRRGLPAWRASLIAGFFVGALQAVRIDSVAFLIGVPVVCAYAWLRARSSPERRAAAMSIAALIIGIVPGVVLGAIDAVHHSGGYYTTLRSNVLHLALVAVASAVVCGIAIFVWRGAHRIAGRFPWRAVSTGVAVAVAVLAFATWALRPMLQHVRGDGRGLVALQNAEHLTVDPTRVYYERSLSWMAWYLGPITVALAIVGGALLLRAILRGGRAHTVAALAVLVPYSLLYLYKAEAVPDHVWVTRRFLLGAFPMFVLLAIGFAAWAASARPAAPHARARRISAIAFAIVAVAVPLWTVVHVRSMAEQRGFLGAVHGVCHDVGPHAAVVVLHVDALDDVLPQTLRSWCGADVASATATTTPDALRRLATRWGETGRPFYVVASNAAEIHAMLPEVTTAPPHHALDTRVLAQTLTHLPRTYRTQSLDVDVARVPGGSP